MCDTSNSDACARQCFVASMMESLYWIGIDHPANGTILPAPCGKRPKFNTSDIEYNITRIWHVSECNNGIVLQTHQPFQFSTGHACLECRLGCCTHHPARHAGHKAASSEGLHRWRSSGLQRHQDRDRPPTLHQSGRHQQLRQRSRGAATASVDHDSFCVNSRSMHQRTTYVRHCAKRRPQATKASSPHGSGMHQGSQLLPLPWRGIRRARCSTGKRHCRTVLPSDTAFARAIIAIV
jgi:hypothetical protein